MKREWPKVRLGEILSHRKQFITIDDLTTYRRPRVQLHAQGIVLRDEVPGALIKTKQQQVCRAGEFLVAEIDAKVGGFGVVPKALDGTIVSSHYFLFDLDEGKLERGFLDHFVRTLAFREQVQAQGSTNYAAIRPADVLGYEIPLPTLVEQRRVVARIEELAAEIHEARTLRQQAAEEAEAFIVSIHVQLAGNRRQALGELLQLDEDVVPIAPAGTFPQVGVRSFGGGLFRKSSVSGIETTYKWFNRLYDGALVLSQVKGWEGAVAICPSELAGWFVSPEYRTFRCVTDEARDGYMAPLVRTEWFWRKLTRATRGVGARRERTRPEQFLQIDIPMPDVAKQGLGEALFAEVQLLRQLQAESTTELDALSPAILDRAFRVSSDRGDAGRSPGRRGVGYRAHFLESIRRDGIVCLECGKLLKALGSHLRLSHHIALDDYRETWGFNRQTAFVAADTATRLRRLAVKRNLGAHGSAELLAKARAARTRKARVQRPESRVRQSEVKKRLYASGWQPRRYRKVEDGRLRLLAKRSVDTKTIARKTGLSIDQARRRLQALGVLPPRQRRRPADRQRILALRSEGLWPLEIARRLHTGPQLVRKILWQFRRQGVPVRTPSGPRPIKRREVSDERFLRARRLGGTPAKIAERLAGSRAYVTYKKWYLRRRGLIAPVPRPRINGR
jgi:type I restriction enzyme S subunit